MVFFLLHILKARKYKLLKDQWSPPPVERFLVQIKNSGVSPGHSGIRGIRFHWFPSSPELELAAVQPRQGEIIPLPLGNMQLPEWSYAELCQENSWGSFAWPNWQILPPFPSPGQPAYKPAHLPPPRSTSFRHPQTSVPTSRLWPYLLVWGPGPGPGPGTGRTVHIHALAFLPERHHKCTLQYICNMIGPAQGTWPILEHPLDCTPNDIQHLIHPAQCQLWLWRT